ncbi:unnamed protein product [Caenorhabditis bovis]|uniref:Major facilitator superfamily (MFS) profile domain-containing protein n=1 Tax=Caenorhabditis bovis TaxID=2654633 RepID=A0A8S1ECS3_9PELO|nr:unnamed protein product [Caenorhabditis bovis]
MAKIDLRLLAMSMLLAMTSIFQMGYTNAYPNTAIGTFRKFLNSSHSTENDMSNAEFEWIWSALLAVYFVGFASGSVLSAGIADRIGRKWTLFLGNIGGLLSTVIALMGVIHSSIICFGISRLIMSSSAAISMNGMILLFQESAPNHMKGLVSFNAEMAFVATNLIGGICGMKAVLGTNLVKLISVSMIPSTLAAVLSFFLRESPKYLYIRKNDGEDAGKSLKFYQNIRDEDIRNKALNELELERIELRTRHNETIFDIISVQHYRRGFLLGFCTMQLTISVWPVLFYSTDFLLDVKFSYDVAEGVSSLMLFLSTLSTIAGMVVVERFSRKWLLIICAIVNVCALSMFSLSAIGSVYYPEVSIGCILALILHGISYSIALRPIAWFITSELVPISCRAAAQCLVLATNHFVALIVTFLTFPLYKLIGPSVIILFFVLPGAICILLLIIYLPETKDRHINDVVDELKHSNIPIKPDENCEMTPTEL